eukprot:scaffold120874_cov17-Prasinocladus_malaysianus.AAC.1
MRKGKGRPPQQGSVCRVEAVIGMPHEAAHLRVTLTAPTTSPTAPSAPSLGSLIAGETMLQA